MYVCESYTALFSGVGGGGGGLGGGACFVQRLPIIGQLSHTVPATVFLQGVKRFLCVRACASALNNRWFVGIDALDQQLVLGATTSARLAVGGRDSANARGRCHYWASRLLETRILAGTLLRAVRPCSETGNCGTFLSLPQAHSPTQTGHARLPRPVRMTFAPGSLTIQIPRSPTQTGLSDMYS